MSEFDDLLRGAVERGKQRGIAKTDQVKAAKMSQEEIKRLHSRYRLALSDKIEKCMEALPDHFPGFEIETIFGEKGWGAAAIRDDIITVKGKSNKLYSRFEMTVRPISTYGVLDLAAKGTVHNKELLRRQYFEELNDVDIEKFEGLVTSWTLEFAELYASKT